MSFVSRLIGRFFGRRKAASLPAGAKVAPMTQAQRSQKLDSPALPEESRFLDWQPVTSSFIVAIRFNPIMPAAQMKIRGRVYTFGGMTFKMFKAWLLSPSKGVYFNKYLKGNYTEWKGYDSLGRGIKAELSRKKGMTPIDELRARQANASKFILRVPA